MEEDLNVSALADLDYTPPGKRPRTLLSDHPLFSFSPCASPEHPVDADGEIVPADAPTEWPGLPRGVKLKFDPSDEELLLHLLAKVGKGDAGPHPLISEFIISLDEDDRFGYTHPQRLPGAKQDGSMSYFFHRKFKVFNPGNRKHQKTQNADFGVVWWRKTGKAKPVLIDGVHQGCKRMMVLYVTMKEGNPEKTNWVMHQYHIGSGEDGEGEFVVSKIFYQQKSSQRDKKAQDLIVSESCQGNIALMGHSNGDRLMEHSNGDQLMEHSNGDQLMEHSSELTTDEGKVIFHSEFSTDEIFKSREDLIKWVRNRGRMSGFVVLINKSELGGKGRKPRLWFGCERGGTYRNHRRGAGKNKEETERRCYVTKKCECPFSLSGKKLGSEDEWILVVECGEHNHPLTEPIKHSFAGRLSEEENALAADMFRRSIPPKDILAALKQRDPYNMATVRTIYNAFHKYKREQRAEVPQIEQPAYDCILDSAGPESVTEMLYESKTLWSFAL